MDRAVLCFCVFLAAYTLNMLYTSVFYHRGLAHRAVRLRAWTERWVLWTGNWVTGIDPKTWVCMHRIHHSYSDTARDPHSPIREGVRAILRVQLRSYGKTMQGLLAKNRFYTSQVRDLKFDVNWINRKRLWFLPHLLQTLIAVACAILFDAWPVAIGFWLGMMSHPIQGWLVNGFAHRYGYRNFQTQDHSTNNLPVAWFVMGEGFQNNHHYRPTSPNFSVKWWECDLGFFLCRVARAFGLIEFRS